MKTPHMPEQNGGSVQAHVQSAAPAGVADTPAHSKSEYKRRVAQGDPNVLPPAGVADRCKSVCVHPLACSGLDKCVRARGVDVPREGQQ